MSKTNYSPEQIAVLSRYQYNPETGLFKSPFREHWWPGSLTRRYKDTVNIAYEICTPVCTLPANHLAYFLMTGQFHAGTIVFINGNYADTRWANLKATTYTQTNQSRKKTVRLVPQNAGLPRGVYPRRSGRAFQALITANHKQIALGTFATAAEAGAAYAAAKRLLHPAIRHSATAPTTPDRTVNQSRLNEVEAQTAQLLQKKNLLPKTERPYLSGRIHDTIHQDQKEPQCHRPPHPRHNAQKSVPTRPWP